MRIVALIPARYAATRFPAKLMQLLGNKPVIRHTYENTLNTGLFDDVIVVTDSDIIYKEITTTGGHAVMSKKEHESGSDRIAEVAATLNADVIVNVQGDEPFLNKAPLKKLVDLFKDSSVQVASLMRKISPAEANNPNNVKVVVDKNGDALYFSRSIMPYPRDRATTEEYFLHIGVYGYTKKALLDFTQWPASKLELAEKLEQLRYLENGIKIRLAETDYNNVAIDTPDDLEKARQLLSSI
jgi:3-deoxy-manno-octulosonate cytidylyltransferase (CMP-KDO synthetase)